MRARRHTMLIATIAAGLVVAGCGGGGDGSSPLALGEEAVVQHANSGEADPTPTTLGVTAVAVRQGTQQELEDGGFTLDPDERELTPYYVDARFENQGEQAIDRRCPRARGQRRQPHQRHDDHLARRTSLREVPAVN